MIAKKDKNADRKQRHIRLRKKIKGTASLPRFNVYRSLNGVYVQIIDDDAQTTLVACSTVEKEIQALIKGKTRSDLGYLMPDFVMENCSGCSNCELVCPDIAILIKAVS